MQPRRDQRRHPRGAHQIPDAVVRPVVRFGDHSLVDAASRLPGEQIGRHPLYAHAAFRRKHQHFPDALTPPVRHADLADAPGTERLEDGIEPVDDHGLEGAGRSTE